MMPRGLSRAGTSARPRAPAVPRQRVPGTTPLGEALFQLSLVWTTLIGFSLALRPMLGAEPASCGAFAAALLLVLATRGPARGGHLPARIAGVGLLGAAAGFASYPAWVSLIASAGLTFGLDPVAPIPPAHGSGWLWLSMLVLAPLFEEPLYRGRLLLALRARLGTAPALVLGSALFAISHIDPWPVLATFAVGLFLGALMLASRSVAACVGVHAGLNLGALACGVPPERLAASAEAGAALALLLTAATIAIGRSGITSSRDHQVFVEAIDTRS